MFATVNNFLSLERLIPLENRGKPIVLFSYARVPSVMKPRAVRPGDSSVCTTSAAAESAIAEITAYTTIGRDENNPQHARHLKDLNYTVHPVTPLKRVWRHCTLIKTQINRKSELFFFNFTVFHSFTVFYKHTRKGKVQFTALLCFSSKLSLPRIILEISFGIPQGLHLPPKKPVTIISCTQIRINCLWTNYNMLNTQQFFKLILESPKISVPTLILSCTLKYVGRRNKIRGKGAK